MNDSIIEKEIHIQARPETVFPFFTDPEKMVQWKGKSAKLEPRNGGMYRVEMNGNNVVRGEYVEITPYSRIVFTWGFEGENSALPPGASTVEVTFEPDDDGTTVTLRHYLPQEQVAAHTAGWNHYMARLAEIADGRDPGPDPWME